MINSYNRFSIKARAKASKEARQGYLFMGYRLNNDGNKALNKKIDTLNKQEERMPEFRKNPIYGSHIYLCCECQKERVYGHCLAEPTNKSVLINCEGTCNKVTRHGFVRVHRGREERWMTLRK